MFKRVDQAVMLNCKSSWCMMSFRLTHCSFSDSLWLQTILKRFELCSYPQALCSGMQFLREANKPVLANAIWSLLPDRVLQLPMILSMCWMAGLCFSAFHREKELLSRRFAQCTQSMSQGSI